MLTDAQRAEIRAMVARWKPFTEETRIWLKGLFSPVNTGPAGPSPRTMARRDPQSTSAPPHPHGVTTDVTTDDRPNA